MTKILLNQGSIQQANCPTPYDSHSLNCHDNPPSLGFITLLLYLAANRMLYAAIEWKGLPMTNTAKTLVIIAHPDLQNQSRVHRRWKEELALHADEFDVRDLYALYPDNTFSEEDISIEQEALAGS